MRASLLPAILAAVLAPAAVGQVVGVVHERLREERAGLRKARVVLYSAKDREIVAATKTDAEGRFALAAPRGVFLLKASKHGFISPRDLDELRIDCRQPCGPFDLELTRGAVLTGRAVDELGEPLEGVNLSLQREDEIEDDADRPPGRRNPYNSHTDDRGHFRIAGIRSGVYTVAGVAATRGPTAEIAKGSLAGVELSEGEEHEIVLTVRPEGYDRFRMAGRVMLGDLAEGDPPGARLFVRMIDGARELRRFSMRSEEIGADGVFSLEGLPTGRYFLSVGDRRGGRSSRRPEWLGTVDLDQDVTGLVLRPMEPSGVKGKIRFEGDEQPSRLMLRLEAVGTTDDMGGSGNRWVSSSMPDFSFRNQQLLPGEYRVAVREQQYYVAEATSEGKPLPGGTIRIEEGRLHDLQVVVSDQTATIAGALRLPDGAPVGNVEVSLEDGRSKRLARTDQNGRFAFERVLPGDVVIQTAGLRREFPAGAGAEIDIDLTIEP